MIVASISAVQLELGCVTFMAESSYERGAVSEGKCGRYLRLLADRAVTCAGKPKHDHKPKGHYGHPKHDPKPAHEHKGHYGKPKHDPKGHYGHAKPAEHEHKAHYGALKPVP